MLDINTMKAVLLYILNKWNGTQPCDVYHIVKTVFYAQKYHMAKYMCPLYHDKIIALPYGPAPSAMYDSLKMARGEERVKGFHQGDGLEAVSAPVSFNNEIFSSIEKPDMDYLSPSQLDCLDKALNEVGQMDFNEILNTTHQEEWRRAFNDPNSKEMNPIAIAREAGADDAALEYLKNNIELDKALA